MTAAVALLVVCRDSSNVFQALHAEHWPCHLLADAPQSRQTKLILALAMTYPFISIAYKLNLMHYFNKCAVKFMRALDQTRGIADPQHELRPR